MLPIKVISREIENPDLPLTPVYQNWRYHQIICNVITHSNVFTYLYSYKIIIQHLFKNIICFRKDKKVVKVVCLRENKTSGRQSIDHSLLLEVQLEPLPVSGVVQNLIIGFLVLVFNFKDLFTETNSTITVLTLLLGFLFKLLRQVYYLYTFIGLSYFYFYRLEHLRN